MENFIPQQQYAPQQNTSLFKGFITPFLFGVGFVVLIIISFEIYAYYKEKKKGLTELKKDLKQLENGDN